MRCWLGSNNQPDRACQVQSCHDAGTRSRQCRPGSSWTRRPLRYSRTYRSGNSLGRGIQQGSKIRQDRESELSSRRRGRRSTKAAELYCKSHTLRSRRQPRGCSKSRPSSCLRAERARRRCSGIQGHRVPELTTDVDSRSRLGMSLLRSLHPGNRNLQDMG